MEHISLAEKFEDMFSRGVETFVDPDDAFSKKLVGKAEGTYTDDIIIKFGVDPTRPDIHIGHAAVLRKLRMLQDVGCKVVFLVGDFTAQIGDPTGKSKVRPEIDQAEVEQNMKTYLDQVGLILRTDQAVFSWIRNSDWFLSVSDMAPKQGLLMRFGMTPVAPSSFVGKALLYENTRMQKKYLKRKELVDITLRGFIATLRHLTHGRLIERDMFQNRLKAGGELYMHEMMYPVLQGIDSVVLAKVYGSCDLEAGGTDQTFNMLMGRDVMKGNDMHQQAVLSVKILPGTDGKEKMSKSLDNYIGITDAPNDMFGKVMSIPDTVICIYYELATFTPMEDIRAMEKRMASGEEHPRDAKLALAEQIVCMYHGKDVAAKARDAFIATFSKKEVPADVKEIAAQKGETLADMLLREEVVESKSAFRRLVDGGGVHRIDGKVGTITDATYAPEVTETIRVGKHTFIKIIVD
ncbi:MAG: tyrosine--tRNA ligase [Candidatus Yonathbacteria bacterium]|nr:tyrosine--tRNA ligase [Candidatus Yonathbacteria bacterium]